VNRAAVAAAAALLLSLPTPGAPLEGATDGLGDVNVAARSAGLQWRFVRIKYHYDPAALRAMQLDVYGEPWGIDSPAAEQNLSRRVKTATSIAVDDPILITLDDPQLFQHPWIYIVEPGALRLTDSEAAHLREFLLRGGTAMLDDFHGPYEWDSLERQMRKVFPDRRITEVTPDHPVFRCFYALDAFPQVAGIGSFLAGRTWEKGGLVPHLRTILDDAGRPMLFINWNTDMGDGWEWSNVEEYPGYLKYTSMAYRMAINEIVYSLTH
jgi:Domain of unknown function (DUF4159)